MKRFIEILEHIFRLPSYTMVILLVIIASINFTINNIIFSFKYGNPIKKTKGDIKFLFSQFF